MLAAIQMLEENCLITPEAEGYYTGDDQCIRLMKTTVGLGTSPVVERPPGIREDLGSFLPAPQEENSLLQSSLHSNQLCLLLFGLALIFVTVIFVVVCLFVEIGFLCIALVILELAL